MNDTRPYLIYGPGGSLCSDFPIRNITGMRQSTAETEYYGAEFFIAASMTEDAARHVANLLGCDLRRKEDR